MPKIPSFSKSTLAQKLAANGKEPPKLIPLWKGPIEDGLTQSLLQRYIGCKERFRVRVIDGLVAKEGFNVRLGYGNMWHVCEEALAANPNQAPNGPLWYIFLKKHCESVLNEQPEQVDDVGKWSEVCKAQFPHYIKYWKNHPDNLVRTPIDQEAIFDLNYRLPSGRVVRLRGKFDSVDVIGQAIYLQENKSKGNVNLNQIRRQLTFDLQTMTYLVALQLYRMGKAGAWALPIKGVRYNVIRRPLSGGKHSITIHKERKPKKGKYVPPETGAEFYKRLSGLIEKHPDHFFQRWRVEVSERDITKFKEEFFHPELENLLDDYEWWDYCYRNGGYVYDYLRRSSLFPKHQRRHARYPFGAYNQMEEAGFSELDNYLACGSRTGLRRVTNLFPELV